MRPSTARCSPATPRRWAARWPSRRRAPPASLTRKIIAQLPALVHLQAPNDATRISLERFSPYYDKPELGFEARRPAGFYDFLYPLSDDELVGMVYHFESDPAGLSGAVLATLKSVVDRWKDAYFDSSLTYEDDGDVLVVRDRREGWSSVNHVIEVPWQVDLYLLLRSSESTARLTGKLRAMGHEVDEAAICAWLDELASAGLIFRESGRSVALATADAPIRVREAVV
jgi:hypothetical protein